MRSGRNFIHGGTFEFERGERVTERDSTGLHIRAASVLPQTWAPLCAGAPVNATPAHPLGTLPVSTQCPTP